MMTAFETIEGCRTVYPEGRRDARLLTHSRFPASALMGAGATVYRWAVKALRQRRLRARPTEDWTARVVSIGNIEVGGNGKTPFAILVIDTLLANAYRPVYVSRGFRSRAERLAPVTICMPPEDAGRGEAPSDVRIIHSSSALAEEIGDEGAMVAMRCPRVPLIFSRDRRRAVDVAVTWLGASHVIVDDAFQTWDLHRDLDIVLVDGRRPLGNGRLVPAGTLREEPAALARAHMVGVNGASTGDALDATRARVSELAGREMPVFALQRRLVFVDPLGVPAQVPHGPLASLSSIARPGNLDGLLESAGAGVRLSVRYPDHHRYGTRDMATVAKLLAEAGITQVVTTEKDWAKLRELELSFAVVLARLELSVQGTDPMPVIEKPQAMPAAFR